MDLIPAEFRRMRRIKLYLRGMLIASGLLVAICLLGWLGLQTLITKEQQRIARLHQKDGQFQLDQSKMADLRQKKQQIEDQLGALARLRGGDQVAKLLRAIDTAHTPGVWFDSVQLRRASSDESNPHSQKQAPGNAASRPALKLPGIFAAMESTGSGVNIMGHALDHSHLAEFMRKLGEQPGMARLYLIDTKPRSIAEIEVIDFALVMQLDTLTPASR